MLLLETGKEQPRGRRKISQAQCPRSPRKRNFKRSNPKCYGHREVKEEKGKVDGCGS